MKWEQICAAQADLKLASLNAKAAVGEHVFQWHSHPFIEWGLVLEGVCRWETEFGGYDLKEDEMMLIPQSVIHREMIPPQSRARLSWIGFSSQLAQEQAGDIGSLSMLNGVPSQMHATGGHILFSDADTVRGKNGRHGHDKKLDVNRLKPVRLQLGRWQQDIRRLFLTIYDEQSESAYGSEERISLCVGELLLLTHRLLLEQNDMDDTPASRKAGNGRGTSANRDTPATRVAANGREDSGAYSVPHRQVQLVHAASRFFDNNTEQGVTIEAVARYFRLTPQYFSTLFRKVRGISPAQYLQGARVRQACRLLVGSQYSIKEIAAQCGYADSAHFCRQFKMHERCSPTQYRLRKASAKA